MGHTSLFGQSSSPETPGEIYQAIQKLNFLGSALYVAAHPDDENQRLIAYLSNEVKANTAYLSLTRGDGGQNLIGPEIRELLGVIRTQELLAARRIDGGNQLFTRANDFGYSKTPEETLEIWDKQEVLSDVVWAMRLWQPDIIINRFNHEPGRRTHGHHTSSAMLSVEAFDLAGDPSIFPEQLRAVKPWQPNRIFFNTSWWFYGSREKFEEADKSRMMSVDVGVYYPLLGKSNNEIAAMARSQHKCQGFGALLSRGAQQEYLQLIKGEMPSNKSDLFEGINTTWTRVRNGEPVGKILAEVEAEFDFLHPAASVPKLMQAYELMQNLPEGNYWKRVKIEEIKAVIAACLGLYLEAATEEAGLSPGGQTELTLEVVKRTDTPLTLKRITFLTLGRDTLLDMPLATNQQYKFFHTIQVPERLSYSNPYWLDKPWSLGMYTVPEQHLRGLPENEPPLEVMFSFSLDGKSIFFKKPLVHKYRDPAEGEIYEPFAITPPVFANLQEPVYIFANEKAQEIPVVVRAGKDNFTGTLQLAHPKGWRVEPNEFTVSLAEKGAEQTFSFQLFPPEGQQVGKVSPIVTDEETGNTHVRALKEIDYDHIPRQLVFPLSESKVVRLNIEKRGQRIGYVMGAGDEIPASLRQIGYQVDLLEDDELQADKLQQYDAIILGIRAYNTRERLAFAQQELFKYAEQGGTLVVQYNTTWNLKIPMEKAAPFPLQISRDRVADETAEVRFLAPDHPVLNEPNKITAADFENWVQERGLYFPDEWDDTYTPILSANDPGEPPRDGGLLVAPVGEGYFVYSGYSWFRELPAGVPGAFRLFANLISLGQDE